MKIPGLVVDDSPDRPLCRPRVTFERSAVAVRAALAAYDRDRLVDFEAEFHIAMAEADDDFDLGRVDAVVQRWFAVALMAANPEYVAAIDEDQRRIEEGDPSVIVDHVERGP
ncbi:DUF6247 family protein [Allokutzneria sp. NRRL B-24872]|uniref:DUF6247 family protein n=1 Tax=Allokutzneria sp. NRRL B-24872 TaxID=1137961 RepID=UPI001AF0122B|nr:DUF6247 family protein [Allokutzneria sp. NRRL B-24872]